MGLSLHTVSRVYIILPHGAAPPHGSLLLPLPGAGHSLGTTLCNSAVTEKVTQERQMAPSEEVWVVRGNDSHRTARELLGLFRIMPVLDS